MVAPLIPTATKRPPQFYRAHHDAVARYSRPAVRASVRRDVARFPAMPPSMEATHRLTQRKRGERGDQANELTPAPPGAPKHAFCRQLAFAAPPCELSQKHVTRL